MSTSAPEPANPTSANIGGGITLSVPTSTASTSSPYGLTNKWGSTQISLTGFPVAVVQALTQAGLDTATPQTGDAVAAALAQIKNPAVVSQVQQMLFWGGFYPNSVTNLTQLQLGKFQSGDISALGNLIQTGGQTGQPLGSYLVSSANYGQAQGTINKIAGVGITPITIPADASIDAALKTAAENELGHDPSPQLLAGFRAMYDQMVIAASKQAAALQAKQNAQTTALSQNPDAVGAAAGRLGLPGYFGDPQEAPPTPGSGSTQTPWQTLIGSPTGAVGPGPNTYQVPGTQADATEFAQEQATQAYQQQHAADQATVANFAGAGTAALAGSQPTVTAAPSLADAADQYVQQNDAGAVQTQNWAQKTNALYSILAGKGF